jgi:predicted alpha/beta-hydrolase family hydrolase
MTAIKINGEEHQVTFIFAHGAGAGSDHPFMETLASLLAQREIRVVRFNFPYMIKQQTENKKRPPDRAPILLEAFTELINTYAAQGPVVIGGKSMGGRMASLLANHDQVAAIACLGFPFHPPGKPERFKGEHLAQMAKPCLILQGERDTFGHRAEVEEMALSSSVRVDYIADGDHSFKPRKKSGVTEAQNLVQAANRLAAFIHEVLNEK